jgi:hypothetical protein
MTLLQLIVLGLLGGLILFLSVGVYLLIKILAKGFEETQKDGFDRPF